MRVRVIARGESMSTYFEDADIQETDTDMMFYYGEDGEVSKVRKNKILKIEIDLPILISGWELRMEWNIKDGWKLKKEKIDE